MAIGQGIAAKDAFTASAIYGATAAAAGVGATAIHSSRTAMGSFDSEVEAPNNNDSNNITNTTREALQEPEVMYISQADFKRMAIFTVDAVSEGLMAGKKLAVR